MIRRTLIFFSVLIISIDLSFSQKIDPQQLIANLVEEYSSRSSKDIDFTSLIEDLQIIMENPIKVNHSNFEELSRLVFLTDFQIQSLLDYIIANGSILSIYEIQLIPGFDQSDAQKLEPFISFAFDNQVNEVKGKLWSGRHEVFIKSSSTIEKSNGYKTDVQGKSDYLGSRYYLSTRYKYNSGNKVEWGINAEKDAGEQFFRGNNQNGFDYFSGYASISNVGNIKRIVIGDFDAGFGQGLTFWSGFSTGKSSEPVNIRKRNLGIIKHSSTNESSFLRGIGASFKVNRFEITGFCSLKKTDANVIDSLIENEQSFTTIYESGLHRTIDEVNHKHRLNEYIIGTNFLYNRDKTKFGLTISHVGMDGNFQKDDKSINLFEPGNEGRTNVGISFEGNLRNHFLFGEYAMIPKNGEFGLILGGQFKLSSLVSYSLLGRYLSRSYSNQYTSVFAEGAGSNNEKGLFSGISISPIRRWRVGAYFDIFMFPWLQYRAYAPSRGIEYLVHTQYHFTENFNGELLYKAKLVDQNYSSDNSRITTLVTQKTSLARCQLTFTTIHNLLLRCRFDFSNFNSDSTNKQFGYTLSQDIGYTFNRIPLSLSFHFSIFDIDTWNTRIYSYENDLLYSFSVPAYYSRGTRTYLMLKYNPTKSIQCWLRWSHTYYNDLEEIGQGNDLILGNTKSDIRMMIRLIFK